MKRSTLFSVFVLLALVRLASATAYLGVDFPLGERSFADAVLTYDPLYSGGPAPDPNPLFNDPTRALGPPPESDRWVSLGQGGLLELAFRDNLQSNSGDSSPDMMIAESAGTAERFHLAVRPTAETLLLLDPALDANADGYFEVGQFIGVQHRPGFRPSFIALIDLDAAFGGFAPFSLAFDAVQIVDDPDGAGGDAQTVGMDVKAAGAIAAAIPEPTSLALASVGLGLLAVVYRRTRQAGKR
jgi:hypothetical protein